MRSALSNHGSVLAAHGKALGVANLTAVTAPLAWSQPCTTDVLNYLRNQYIQSFLWPYDATTHNTSLLLDAVTIANTLQTFKANIYIGAGTINGTYNNEQNTIIGQSLWTSNGTMLRNTLIGANCVMNGVSSSVGVGQAITLGNNNCVQLGVGAATTGDNQAVMGSGSYPINNVWAGKGVTNASATAYTINGTGGSGSNNAGADLNLAGGKHTGTPSTQTAGNVRVQTSIVGASASSQNSLVDRVIVKAGRLTLTNSSASNVVDVALPTLTGTAGMIRYEVYATDGTDVQVRRGSMQYSAVNKSGTYTSETAVTAEAASCSAGTLTATWGIANGTNKITVQVTPTSSLTTTTLYLCYQIENNSEQAVTIL